MRIGIVAQSYHPVLGGVTEQVQGLAISLLRRGHDITVLTGSNRGASISSEEMRLRRAGGEIIRIGRPYRVQCNGASVTIVGEPGLSSGLRAVPRDRFDVVHIHSPLEPFLPAAAAFWFDAPIVGTFHSAGRRGRGYRIFRPLLEPVMQRLAVRTAVSASAREYVERVFPGQYRLIPNGVELDRFTRPPHPRVDDAKSPVRLLMVGRLDPRKGHDVVLEALERLTRDRGRRGTRASAADWHLDVVGHGSLHRRLEVRSRGLPATLYGPLSSEGTANLYRRADLFLAPAQYGESFGVVLLEAMASGCAIIASDIAGYRDVLAGSGAGLLVARDDPDAWATSIRQLVSRPDRMDTMARAGEAYVTRFSWDLLAAEMERVYEEAVGVYAVPFVERRTARIRESVSAIAPRG